LTRATYTFILPSTSTHRAMHSFPTRRSSDLEEAKRILNAPEYAVLATVEPDGQPQLSVVWVAREDEEVLVSTVRGRRKELNLRRDPKVTILVYPADHPQESLEVRGEAAVVEDPGGDL